MQVNKSISPTVRLTLRGRVIFMSNGAWGDGHNGVNVYMASYREKVADQITALVKKYDFDGTDISKINIGIAVYGRPLNGAAFWASWRALESANYWESKYYNIPDSNQIYDGTFCAPALAGDKTAYALLSGAGGVMIFRADCDKPADDPNSVTGGIQDALNRYVTGW